MPAGLLTRAVAVVGGSGFPTRLRHISIVSGCRRRRHERLLRRSAVRPSSLVAVCAKNGDWHRVSPDCPSPQVNLRAERVPVPAFRRSPCMIRRPIFIVSGCRHAARAPRVCRSVVVRRVSRPDAVMRGTTNGIGSRRHGTLVRHSPAVRQHPIWDRGLRCLRERSAAPGAGASHCERAEAVAVAEGGSGRGDGRGGAWGGGVGACTSSDIRRSTACRASEFSGSKARARK